MAGKVTIEILSNQDIAVSSGVFANMVKTTQQSISNYRKEGIPHIKDGGKFLFPVYDSIKWLYERGKLKDWIHDTTKLDDEVLSLPPKQRQELAGAKLKEFQLAVLNKDYVNKEQVINDVQKVLKAFRDRSLALPKRAAPLLSNNSSIEERESILNDLVYELLEELSKLED